MTTNETPFPRIAAAVAAAAVVFATSAARADEKDTLAEGLFRDAQKLLTDGKVHEACEKFSASQRVQPALGTLLNLAACHEKEGRTATAWSEYADVYAQATRDGDAARAEFAKRHHDALEPRLTRVVFDVQAPADGETLSFDGVALPQVAWTTPLPTDPGAHALHAAAPGRATLDTSVVVATAMATSSSAVQHVSVPSLGQADASQAPAPSPSGSGTGTAASPAPAGSPDQAAVAPPPSHTRRTVGIVVTIGGAVATLVGAGFLVGAAGKAGDRDSACAAGVPCPNASAYDRASAAYDSAKTDQIVGFVVGGVGVAAIAAGAYLWLTGDRSSPSGRVGLAPSVGPGGAGLTAAGTF